MDPHVLTHLGTGSSFYTVQSELPEARMIFEVKLAGLAAMGMTDRDLGQMKSLLRSMDQFPGNTDWFSKLKSH